MGFYIAKILITSVLVIAISEIAKRSSFLGALLASIPIISIMAMIWLYIETKDILKVASLSSSVFWLVIPSLLLFLVFPLLLKSGVSFYVSLGISIGITAGFYFLLFAILQRFGFTL